VYETNPKTLDIENDIVVPVKLTSKYSFRRHIIYCYYPFL